ncbi:MAG: MATE family efflux transporter [Eubacteriaceae bacterium]
MASKSLTEGVVWKNLLFFALPLLGTSLIQQLYNTVDLIFVGNFLGAEETAAVGASTLFVTCLVGFFSGMSVGASAVTAYVFGTKDKKALNKVIHTAVALGFICGLAVTLIGIIAAPAFLKLINTPDQILTLAVSYVRVYFLSILALVTYNMAAGIIRSLGDAKATMKIQLIGGLVNVLMDALAILVFKQGVVGVAMASFFSQTVAAGLALLYLMRLDPEFRLRLRALQLDRDYLMQMIRIGVPSGLQAMLITLSNLVVQSQVNSLGVSSIAAFAAYFKVELLLYLPILAMGQAIATFTGQNIGAGKLERVRQGTKSCLLMGGAITIISSGLLLLFGSQAFSLIIKDPEVVALGQEIIKITFPFYWIYLVMEVLAGTIRGAGKAGPPMLIILLNIFLIRTSMVFVMMTLNGSITGIAAIYPITWASTAVFMAAYYFKGNWIGTFEGLKSERLKV